MEELIDYQIEAQERAYNKSFYYKINGVLIKKIKPCHENDRVHIHRWEGCYKVHSVDVGGFTIRKNGEFVYLPWAEFRCKSHEGNSQIKHEKARDKKNISDINAKIKLLEKVKAKIEEKWQ